jgi:hypothetical protein
MTIKALLLLAVLCLLAPTIQACDNSIFTPLDAGFPHSWIGFAYQGQKTPTVGSAGFCLQFPWTAVQAFNYTQNECYNLFASLSSNAYALPGYYALLGIATTYTQNGRLAGQFAAHADCDCYPFGHLDQNIDYIALGLQDCGGNDTPPPPPCTPSSCPV